MKALRVCTIVLLLCLAFSAKGAARVESEPAKDVVLKFQLEGISKQYGIAIDELKPLTDSGMKADEIRKYLESLYPTKGFRITTEACADLRQKTGLSMEDALKCLQLSVRFGKDPELLAQLVESVKGWDELESSLLKYTKARDAAEQASTNMKDKQRATEAASLIASEFMCSSSDVYRLMEKGASVEKASAIIFFFDISRGDKPLQAVIRVEELPQDWMKELPEELERFTEKWPVRSFPKEYLPLDPNKAKQASAAGFRSGIKASSLPDPVDISDYATLYNVERVSPYGGYYNGLNECYNPSDGSLVIAQTDFTLPGRYGNDFEFKRYYDSSQSRLEEFKVQSSYYYEVQAGQTTTLVSGPVKVVDPEDGSYNIYYYYLGFEYPSQTSDDGIVDGIELDTVQIWYYYSDGTCYDLETTTTEAGPATGYADSSDLTQITTPSFEIYPASNPQSLLTIATGWFIDGLPLYEWGGTQYLHFGSAGSFRIKSDGYLDNTDSKEMQILDFPQKLRHEVKIIAA